MKRYLPLLVAAGMASFTACQSDRDALNTTTPNDTQARSTSLVETNLRDKVYDSHFYALVKEEALSQMQVSNSGELSLSSAAAPLQRLLKKVGVQGMHRLFPHAGKYEARTRAEGLHRWMIVEIDKSQDVLLAVATLQNAPEFELVEPSIRPVLPKFKYAPYTSADQAQISADSHPFNDPMLPQQWHYHNTGSNSGSIKGADINLYKAWETEKGRPEVVVCIVDGGVDLDHEDLVQNIDRDNSFCYMLNPQSTGEHDYYKPEIYVDDVGHGTHVAGTVGAVNNNGIGVSGVAGGDGSAASGIRIISHQIFGKLHPVTGATLEDSNTPAALKEGADHGAVISQNSWGGPFSAADRAAIDYFIKYAGCDEKGEQLPNSPMKGGVVIFAAGNEDRDYMSYPGAYGPCIAVSSFGWDFVKASYTTRGDWVDIAAPGGDQDRFGISRAGVLSTMPTSIAATGYGFMQGTSMACPHVSGVAALLVSKHGGKGFTADDLEKILLSSLRPYDIYAYNPNYVGRLGVGYIDAAAALLVNQNKAPKTPELGGITPGYNNLAIAWKASSDEDGLDGSVPYYNIYVSDKELTASNYKSATSQKVYSNGAKPGELVTHIQKKLVDDTQYYIAIEAIDRFDLRSQPLIRTAKTKFNNAPTITKGAPESHFVLLSTSRAQYNLEIEDKDGHSWSYHLSGDQKGLRMVRKSKGLLMTLTPSSAMALGEHSFTLTLVDELNKSTEYTFTYNHVKYEAPRLIANFDNLVLGLKGGTLEIPLTDKFAYTADLKPTFSVKSDDDTVVTASLKEGNKLVLTPERKGLTTVKVTLNDGVRSVSADFNVRVLTDASASVYGIYPIPVKDRLRALVNPNISQVTFVVTTLRGEVVLRKKVSKDESTHEASLTAKSLTSGTYNLTILAGKETYKSTFIKQ